MKNKPKSAIAKLMDSVSVFTEQHNISGTAVVKPEMQSVTEDQNETCITNFIPKFESNTLITLSDDKPVLKYIDPKYCQPWKFSDRPEDEMGDIDELSNSIEKFGQQEPILVRPVSGKTEIDFEVIFGNRRWRACRKKNIKVLAIIKKVTDQEAALYQKEENENREDLSDLARAKSFKAQLDGEIFSSEHELSKSLGISRQNLNDIMAFNRIPQTLVSIIPNLKNISRKMATKLATLSKDEKTLNILIRLAPKISQKEVNSSNIDIYINKVLSDKSIKQRTIPIQVRDTFGKKMFIIKQASNGETNIVISKNYFQKCDIDEIKKTLIDVLNKTNQ
jgi:ParB family chromosome partitioning protein